MDNPPTPFYKILILPATELQNGLIAADRARAAVERIDFIYRKARISLRVSTGLAGWIPKPEDTPEVYIQGADNALYQAKREGRNRAVAYT